MPAITVDEGKCAGCALCEAFCPVSVFEMRIVDGRSLPVAVRAEDCWACDTCVGQCPEGAIQVVEESAEDRDATRKVVRAAPLSEDLAGEYRSWSDILSGVLGLRWDPVAISLIPSGAPLPDAPVPRQRLRYCQSLMAARRGGTFLMPAKWHACPDGTSILGLTEIPPKLASGELYLLFKKLGSIEAARRMIAERPRLEPRSIAATLVSPLDKAIHPVDVVAVVAQPEQMLWIVMSTSFFTGERFEFHMSGYNAQCVETTLYPFTTGRLNASLGCYGCRASSDVSDDLMFMGIPASRMPEVVSGLVALGKKAVPDSRAKIYLPPLS